MNWVSNEAPLSVALKKQVTTHDWRSFIKENDVALQLYYAQFVTIIYLSTSLNTFLRK